MAGSKRRAAKPRKRNGFWYLVRRVPEEFLAVDDRGVVRLSTGIRIVDDPRAAVAAGVVAKLDANLVTLWRARGGPGSHPVPCSTTRKACSSRKSSDSIMRSRQS